MNKKEIRTRLRIHEALESLLLERGYGEISTTDIVVRSGVARSTFYKHYKGKDDVLVGLTDHIFEHVFSANLPKEKGHDFSDTKAFDYRHIVTHVFCHFGEDRKLLKAIFESEASHLFGANLREQATPLIEAIYGLTPPFMNGMPKEIAISSLLGLFVGLLKTYVVDDRNETAEEMAEYFFRFRFA